MIVLVLGVWTFLRALFIGAAAVGFENVALRQQLVVLQRSGSRSRVCQWDRVIFVWLSRLWTGWRSSVVIVRPATVLAWHRQGFQLYWRWKSRPLAVGRPRISNTTVSKKLGNSWGTLATSAYAQAHERARPAVSRVC